MAKELSEVAGNVLEDPGHSVYLSIASIWEMQIKSNLGKLTFNLSIGEKVASQREHNNLIVLPILANHIYELENIGDHHRDPFDRLLIAQARQEDMVLVTADSKIEAYDVKTLW